MDARGAARSAKVPGDGPATASPEGVSGECRGPLVTAPLPAVNRPGANHLDRRRTLSPRNYFPPGSYGKVPSARSTVPPGGDHVSAAVAQVQHDLLVLYRQVRKHGWNRRAAGAFGISDSVWQDVMTGKRWMGETVMAALLVAVHRW